MKFQTEHSTYEWAPLVRMIRRVTSDHEPTPRQGDGDWQPCQIVMFHSDGPEGYPAIIVWLDGGTTITSPVVAIEVPA